MTLIPLPLIPVEARRDYALSLVGSGVMDGWEALAVTVFPPNILVPEFEFRIAERTPPRKATCEDCGAECFTRGGPPRCRSCFDKAQSERTKGFCSNGHPWTPENVYTRPNGYEYCRECARHYKSAHRQRTRRRYFRVPCTFCGEPCCPPEHKNKDGAPFARCRKCYMEARRERRAAA